MTDISNIRDVVGIYPDFIGYIFYPGSARYIGSDPDRRIFREVPSEILKTGVFVNEPMDVITEKKYEFGLDFIQLHGDESPEDCRFLKEQGIKVIKSFSMDDNFRFSITESYEENCEYFLFDTKSISRGGSGNKFDWSVLNYSRLGRPFFLSGGIRPDDFNTVMNIKNDKLFAVDINSRFEINPGIKDIDRIVKFINEFRKWDN